jgi:hypothetical protein
LAEVPSDVRWPPGSDIDFDDIFERLLSLKTQHFPEHTARDLADPYIQIMALMGAMGQHAMGRVNHALLQLSPKTATSRAALVSILEIVNRPLLPIQPARGPFYAKVSGSYVGGDELVNADQRLAPPSVQDPVFTVDEAVTFPASTTFRNLWHDAGTGAESSTSTYPVIWPVGTGDYLQFDIDTLAFDGLTIDFTAPLANPDATISLEYRNEEYGAVDSVTNLGATLRFVLNEYLHRDTIIANPTDLEVTIRHRPTGVTETSTVGVTAGNLTTVTSFLGQASPSTSTSDYEVFAEWRPIKNAVDTTTALSADGSLSWAIGDVFDSDDLWVDESGTGKYAVRVRFVDMGTNADPSNITIAGITLITDGSRYVVGDITQGYRSRVTVGQTDGSEFQFLPLPSDIISEPVADPKIVIEVGSDTEWVSVDDFSNSDSTSKHGVIREDPDDGWGVEFGDGSVGKLPDSGEAVRLTFRTGSVEPGDLDPVSSIRSLGGLNRLDEWTIFRGTSGFAEPEASTRATAMRFRASVLPQLALRAESAVTSDEIVTAMTGGAPNRATFKTADGRAPFSRALFTLEGAGDRQYRVVVVGSESDDVAIPASTDLVEAEEWLNGVEVGVQVIGGHGPNNTEAIVSSYSPRYVIPTVTITIPNTRGVKDQAASIVRQFFKPHARDPDTEEFMWDFGGKVPMALLFSRLWDGVPGRTLIQISASDGVTTYGIGDTLQLLTTELPALDSTFDADVNIVLVEG